MRRGVVVVAALAVFTLAGCSSVPSMTAADARDFTGRALTDAGLSDVRVDPQVVPTRYTSTDPRFRNQPIEVFQTRSVVAGGQVELYVPKRGDAAVYVRDVSVAGGQLLNPDQFHRLEQFRYNASDERQSRQTRRIGAGAVALVVVVAALLFAAVLSGAADRRPRLHSRGAPPDVRAMAGPTPPPPPPWRPKW